MNLTESELARLREHHAEEQRAVKAALLGIEGIRERIEVGARENKRLHHPFREQTSADFLSVGRVAAALILAVTLSAPASAALDPRCPTPHGAFGSSSIVGGRILCLTDTLEAGKYELHSLDIASGAIIRLSPDIAADRDVIRFAASPDGSRVAFTCDRDRWTQYELWTVPIAGGPAVKVSGPIAPDYDVDDFVWSSRSDQVVFRYGRNATGVWNLYAVKAGGGSLVQLNPPPVEHGAVQQGFSVALGIAAYRCDCEVDGREQEYFTALPGTIFGDGFEGGNTGGWR